MNIMRRLILIVVAAVTIFSPPVHAKEQKGTPPSVATVQKLPELITNAKTRLRICEDAYHQYVLDRQMAEREWDLAYNAAQAVARLNGGRANEVTMRQVAPYHNTCAEGQKQAFIPIAKATIQSIKKSESQKATKEMVAQWITAIDSIGNEGAKAERAKFETIANGLMLDI